MDCRIVEFDVDEEEHWRAKLECGHYQHVRHDPPLNDRGWVTTESGRRQKIGNKLNCVKCDDQAPSDLS